ncbi:MAG: hypothetical protein HS108_16175 [Planctomycetes bacterium]|nr:hypothetical protein [Planctomycetota bacterium]MCL4729238.1 hypothetical protein [Planctomycetota bacterium]
MKRTLLLLVAAATALALVPQTPATRAQTQDEFVLNPDLHMPPGRVESDASLGVREARQRITEAMALEAEGKREEALGKWSDALGRYTELRNRFLKPERAGNGEVFVRGEFPAALSQDRLRDSVFTDLWVPLADHINGNFREYPWPRALRDRFIMRQQAPGAEMLAAALHKGDYVLLRRCARYFQFSDAGRTALMLLADDALEAGDSLLALRWLQELQGAWPEHFWRDGMLQLKLVRACHEVDARMRLNQTLRRIEMSGQNPVLDVGGTRKPLSDHIAALLALPAPADRRELSAGGWRTHQGGFERNRAAPPVSGIVDVIPLGSGTDKGFRLGAATPKPDAESHMYRDEDTPAVPVLFPTAHEAGFFVHRPQGQGQGAESVEQLLWFRHGREQSPVQLEVPKALRYQTRMGRGGGGRWWGGRSYEPRQRVRVLGSTIARLRWDLDQRESDVLFAVMGVSSPQTDRGNDPTGNQIQALDLSSDVSLRVTLPNRKVESPAEFAFLQHVTFMGAPVVVDNKLYVGGAIAEKSSIEYWLFCFDVTPKGDPAAGEGKLLWRTHCCSLANRQAAWGPQTVTLTDMSSMAMQGGMLYLNTHCGATVGVDRRSGELCWVSRYRRPMAQIQRGWFANPPVAANGCLITAPYDSIAPSGSELALVLDGITGTCVFEQPHRGKGYKGEYEYLLGVVDNRMVIQGRRRLHCIALTDFRRGGGINEAEWGGLAYQSTDFKSAPIGRGVIAGDRVLIPFKDQIWVLDVRTGKLLSEYSLAGLNVEGGGPATLTVYCRGEAYSDEEGLTRYRPVTVTDPVTGNVYNVEHLPNGAQFRFPSGATATVKKETFVVLASSTWLHLFSARDN